MRGRKRKNAKQHKYENPEQCSSSSDRKRVKCGPVFCVLHISDLQDYGEFVPFTASKTSVTSKLDKLKALRDKRLMEPVDSKLRMEEACKHIPENIMDWDLDTTGYHRVCYQRFTMNQDRLTGGLKKEGPTTAKHRSPRVPDLSLQFPQTCIFCKLLTKRRKLKRESCSDICNINWKDIPNKALAMGKSSLFRLVNGVDLKARNAKYHRSCYDEFQLKYLDYIRKQSSNKSMEKRRNTETQAMNKLKDFVQKEVISNKRIVSMKTLKKVYCAACKSHGLYVKTKVYRKIMIKLSAAFTNIDFIKLKGNTSQIYSTEMTLVEALESAYNFACTEVNHGVALNLRNTIKQSFSEARDIPWPLTPDDLDDYNPEDIVPKALQEFIGYMVEGSADIGNSGEKNKRIILSICQDICRAATSGEWKMMKHILLSITVRHMYRSKLLATILSRLGHSETYDFSLELETSLAKALNDCSTSLTPTIVKGDGNKVFHVEWDNLNKITTNVFGPNVVNSTGGIMIQELHQNFDVTNNQNNRLLDVYRRSNVRSLHVDSPELLAPVLIYNRTGPKFPMGSRFTYPDENDIEYSNALLEYRMWSLARIVSSSGTQEVPGLGGFVSSCGKKPTRKSTIEYFTPIDQPFTEYAVIEELLARSEKATEEVGQEYVLSTFDLGGCMKALPLIWKDPERYKKHVVTPGAFHTAMNYIGVLTGKKCAGSGYAEIIMEAGLVTTGCVNNVLNGKAYSKALLCLKATTEAFERLLFDEYLALNTDLSIKPEQLINLIIRLDRESLNEALTDPSTRTIIDNYIIFEDSVRDGSLGKTARFWMSFIDKSRLVLMLVFAVKTNNLTLFHSCCGEMAVLFFAYDGPNYSRYLTWLEVFLTNIELTHPGAKELLQSGGIAVTRSLIPGTCSAVDKTMEETFMKFAKSPGGFSGIFSMFGAYQRWCRTTSTRARFYEKMLDMCGLIDDPDCPKAGRHRELEKAEIRKSEEAVANVLTAISSFTNPFKVNDKDHLYSLASGAPVTAEVEIDVLRAEDVGRQQKDTFINERLTEKTSKNFFEPVSRNKLKTMEAANKAAKLTAPQGKIIQYREQSNLAFMILVKSQLLREPVDLQLLMQYPLTPVPHSLGTPDGFFNKTNKASLMNAILEDETFTNYPGCDNQILIQDGNALFHELKNLAPTFGGICLQILDIMVKKKNFIFSTDCYFEDSIKFQERKRRGTSTQLILDGPATRRPADFKEFLSNDANKKQFCSLLLRVWSEEAVVTKLAKCGTAIIVVDGRAYNLKADSNQLNEKEIYQLRSNQEETDTRVILYLQYSANQGFKSAIVRTPDSDIFFICLHHAERISTTIYVDIGTGKQRRVVNISELANSQGSEYCTTLLGFHVFTGEDVTSAFKGKGKLLPLRKLQNSPKYQESFRMLGNSWIVDEDTMKQLEAFVCLMYGCRREKDVNTARFILLKKMIGVDENLTINSKVELSRLPPCRDNLEQHIKRVNFRVAVLKRAHEPIIESPKPYESNQGWVKDDLVEPKWASGPILPSSMVELVEDAMEEVDAESTEISEFEDISISDEED